MLKYWQLFSGSLKADTQFYQRWLYCIHVSILLKQRVSGSAVKLPSLGIWTSFMSSACEWKSSPLALMTPLERAEKDEPCGTPQLSGRGWDRWFPSLICCVQQSRMDLNQVNVNSVAPAADVSLLSCIISAGSNVADRSNRLNKDGMPWSADINAVPHNITRADSILCLVRNSDWIGYKHWFSSTLHCSWWVTTLSMILATIGELVTGLKLAVIRGASLPSLKMVILLHVSIHLGNGLSEKIYW